MPVARGQVRPKKPESPSVVVIGELPFVYRNNELWTKDGRRVVRRSLKEAKERLLRARSR